MSSVVNLFGKVPRLDTIVNMHTRDLAKRRVRQDIFSRNHSSTALEILDELKPKVQRALGDDAFRAPYSVHAAFAALDVKGLFSNHDLLRVTFCSQGRYYEPPLDAPSLRPAVQRYGREDVELCLWWLSREPRARNCCYGTGGLYLRRYFMSQCVHFREVLGSRHQAPSNWLSILEVLVYTGAVDVVGYMNAKGSSSSYPVYSFSRE